MADNIMNPNDFIGKGTDKAFDPVIANLEKIIKLIDDDFVKAAGDLAKEFEKISKSTENFGDKLKELQKAQDKAVKIEKQQAEVLKKLEDLKKKEIQVNNELEKQKQQEAKTRKDTANAVKAEQQAKQALNKTAKQNEAQTKKLTSLYTQQSRTLTELRNKAKETGLQYGTNSKQFRRQAKAVNELDTRLKNLDVRLGQNQRLVGKYGDALKGLGGSFKSLIAGFGVVTGVQAFTSAVTEGLGTIIGYEKAVSRLKAISGATGDDLKSLTDDALALGGATEYTAEQITNLQVAFAKKGFATNEILNATAATLDLATAAGVDLVEAADVAGSVVRGFGKDSSETQNVVDQLAVTLTKSAAGFEDYQEAIKLVAPIAKAANIPLETTNLLIGKLADVGLRGSIAGTGLKNILTKLADENSKLSKELGFGVKNANDLFKAFELLREKNIDLTKATELTDERSKAAFLTFIDGVSSTDKLAVALENADGAATKMSETMRDNLATDIKLAESAWDGFVLSLEQGEGRISKNLRSIVQEFTNIINRISIANKVGLKNTLDYVEGLDMAKEELKQFGVEVDSTYETLKDATKEEKESFVDSLNTKLEGYQKERAEQKKLVSDSKKIQDQTSGEFSEVAEQTAKTAQIRVFALDEIIKGVEKKYNSFKKTIEKEAAIDPIPAPVVERTIENLEKLQRKAVGILSSDAIQKEGGLLFGSALQEQESIINASFNDQISRAKAVNEQLIAQKKITEEESAQELIDIEKQKNAAIADLYADDLVAYKATNEKKTNDDRLSQEEREQLTSASLAALGTLNNQLFQISSNNNQRQLADDINRIEQSGLSEEQKEEKISKLKKDAAEREKDLAISQAVINGALAVTNILAFNAGNPILAAGLIALTIAETLGQVAVIESQQFADGTDSVTRAAGEKKGTDTVHAMVDEGEMIVRKKEAKQLRDMGVTRFDLPEIVKNGLSAESLIQNPIYSLIDVQQLGGVSVEHNFNSFQNDLGNLSKSVAKNTNALNRQLQGSQNTSVETTKLGTFSVTLTKSGGIIRKKISRCRG